MKKLKYDYLSGSAGKRNKFRRISNKRIKISIFTLFLLSFLLLCCTPSLMPPVEADVTIAKQHWSNISLSQLNEGHTLYINKCGHCHYLHRPDMYSDEKWNKMLPIMAGKAKLDSLQLDLISKYIFTVKETKSFARKK